MSKDIILASASLIRRQLLANAGVPVRPISPQTDESNIKASLIGEDAKSRDIADALAEFKARKVAQKNPSSIVIGADQILDCGGTVYSKPTNLSDCMSQITALRGRQHSLFSAAVIYEDGMPVWRCVAEARMMMRDISDEFLREYVPRNWADIQHCVGGYQLEGEGARLFARVDGDYFTVLGLPLIEVLTYLTTKGLIKG